MAPYFEQADKYVDEEIEELEGEQNDIVFEYMSQSIMSALLVGNYKTRLGTKLESAKYIKKALEKVVEVYDKNKEAHCAFLPIFYETEGNPEDGITFSVLFEADLPLFKSLAESYNYSIPRAKEDKRVVEANGSEHLEKYKYIKDFQELTHFLLNPEEKKIYLCASRRIKPTDQGFSIVNFLHKNREEINK